MNVEIQGTADARFVRVKDAFASCFADGYEHGGAVAAVVEGKMVVDLWGGHRDAAGVKPWQRGTLVNVWSVTKGIVALAAAQLAERGKLQYDRPVAQAWPAFAANGKAEITLDLVMSHQAGLNGLSVPMDEAGLYAWTPFADALAAMAPLWQPGSRCVYHALSFGHLVGEPLRRTDGRGIGRFVQDEIAGPLGVPFYIGLPESEEPKVAEIIEGPKVSDWLADMRAGPYPHAIANPAVTATAPNNRAWRAAEIPGGNGHSTASALATIYGGLALGASPLISRAGLAEATRARFRGMDEGFNLPAAYGAGFRLGDAEFGASASADSFGHPGWGGSTAFADPEAGVGFAFVTHSMLGFDDGRDVRRERLTAALYEAL